MNRDYRTRERIAKSGLAKHFQRMTELIAEGKSREEASRLAYRRNDIEARSPKMSNLLVSTVNNSSVTSDTEEEN